MKPNPRNILVVDDEPVVRAGLVHLLGTHPGIGAITEADSAESALKLLTDELDVLVTDLKMGGLDGFALTRLAKRSHPGLPILVLSSWDETLYAEQALEAGASGYLMKSTDPVFLRDAIDSIGDGHLALSDSSWNRMLAGDPEPPQYDGLHRRIFQSLAGVPRPPRALAHELGVRTVEVEHALHAMCIQAGLTSPLQLLLLAHRSEAPVRA